MQCHTRRGAAALAVTVVALGAGCGGGDPSLSASPDKVDFGDQDLGKTSAAQTVVVAGDSRDDITIERIAFLGTNTKQFKLADGSECKPDLVVEEDGRCRLAVQFVPSGLGERSARLAVYYDSEESPVEIELEGVSVGEPGVSLGANRLEMGSVLVGQGPRTKQTTLTNTGNAPLDIDSIEVEGDADDFELATATTCSDDAAVPPGETCVVAVAFSPTETGKRSAEVVIEHNAASSPSRIDLAGTGTANANAKISTSSLDFGSIEVGTKSGAKSVKLSNSGGAPLTITGIGIGGANAGEFTLQSGGCTDGTRLDPGQSCTAKVLFAPAAAGDRSATLAIVTDASSNPKEITLTGTGTEPEPEPEEPAS